MVFELKKNIHLTIVFYLLYHAVLLFCNMPYFYAAIKKLRQKCFFSFYLDKFRLRKMFKNRQKKYTLKKDLIYKILYYCNI